MSNRIVKIGDSIMLYEGDCREIYPELGKIEALLTDPPYGIGFASQPTKWQRRAGMTKKGWDEPEYFDTACRRIDDASRSTPLLDL